MIVCVGGWLKGAWVVWLASHLWTGPLYCCTWAFLLRSLSFIFLLIYQVEWRRRRVLFANDRVIFLGNEQASLWFSIENEKKQQHKILVKTHFHRINYTKCALYASLMCHEIPWRLKCNKHFRRKKITFSTALWEIWIKLTDCVSNHIEKTILNGNEIDVFKTSKNRTASTQKSIISFLSIQKKTFFHRRKTVFV